MDYEKLYKEALERAKKKYSAFKGMKQGDVIEDIFPVLKESDDERIRKVAIEFVKQNNSFNNLLGISKDEVIDWLEKQSEQKPADKVEPKFHEGDWTVSNLDRKARQISEVHLDEYNSYYVVNGKSVNLEEYDRLHHLWTIEDAKHGDVLEFGDHGRLVIGIVSYVNKTTGKVDVNCLLENNTFKVGTYYNLDTTNPHPVTQEHHDLLFHMMKEFGYEWDSEKKELKKIEQKPAGWSNTDLISLGYLADFVGKNGDEFYGKNKPNVVKWIHSFANLTPPHQKWSEEDEKKIDSIISNLKFIEFRYPYLTPIYEGYIDLLKSIKLQNTWKPSEEQMSSIQQAVENMKQSAYYDSELVSLYNDLKKLTE